VPQPVELTQHLQAREHWGRLSSIWEFLLYSTVLHPCGLKLCSHCQSDQLDRSNCPNSPTQLDHCLVGLVRDLFPTESAGVWSSSDQVAVELIGYWSVQKMLSHSH